MLVQADKKRSKAPTTGVDGLLESFKTKPKKINTVEKSEVGWMDGCCLWLMTFFFFKIDWDMQKQDKAVQEELRVHLKSGTTYLEKQSFLKRAELREYELEREGKRK